MRTPIRKPGKYTHSKIDPNITEEKFKELNNKIEKLKKSQPFAAAEVKRLAEMGDFSENAAYQMAKGRLRGINQRILDLEKYLKTVIIIRNNLDTDLVELGKKVTVASLKGEKTFLILGSSETDPLKNIISHNSPIGSALIGKKVGDTAVLHLKDRRIEYKIIKIE